MSARGTSIAKSLEDWFAVAQRPMPWRHRPEPYVCWLSEIMMQQTTYGTVLPYYERFLKRFPSVVALAKESSPRVPTQIASGALMSTFLVITLALPPPR